MSATVVDLNKEELEALLASPKPVGRLLREVLADVSSDPEEPVAPFNSGMV